MVVLQIQGKREECRVRIDYFITSPQLKDKLEGAEIHSEIMGSDHCPVELQITL